MYLPKGVQMQSPIGAKWSPSCPKRWTSVVSILCSSQLVPGGLHFRYHLAMRCIKWVSLILLQRLECLLLLRNGVIGKSKVKDWWRVGHYLVGMAITAPCDHFVDSWQPLADHLGFYGGHKMSTWWLFGDLCESIENTQPDINQQSPGNTHRPSNFWPAVPPLTSVFDWTRRL